MEVSRALVVSKAQPHRKLLHQLNLTCYLNAVQRTVPCCGRTYFDWSGQQMVALWSSRSVEDWLVYNQTRMDTEANIKHFRSNLRKIIGFFYFYVTQRYTLGSYGFFFYSFNMQFCHFQWFFIGLVTTVLNLSWPQHVHNEYNHIYVAAQTWGP